MSALTRAAAGIMVGLAVVAGVVVTPTAARADVNCSSDQCDAGAWASARGESNQNSYWGMFAGHNCTNYVAWRLIQDGVPRPRTGPGNAADWAANALADGYVVDLIPAVGAVAQWDANTGGYGAEGHVAYIEKIDAGGTVEVSEDYWHGGDQTGQLTYRTLDASTISHVIHYGEDRSQFLRTVSFDGSVWNSLSTVLDPAATAFTAVGGSVFYVDHGQLFQASGAASPASWGYAATGLTSSSSSLSAVEMGTGRPYVMSVEDGTLFMDVDTDGGWQKMSTGLDNVTGTISAVDTGGLWPTVLISQAGTLYEAWGDMEGWHVSSTGLEVWGPVAALNVAGSLEVYSAASSQLRRSWLDDRGWHQDSTGVLIDALVGAVQLDGRVEVVAAQAGTLLRVHDDGGRWSGTSLGVATSSFDAVVDAGRADPVVVQLGRAAAGRIPVG